MLQKIALAAMVTICCGFVCLGQENQPAASAGGFQIKVVKGIPFSATVVTESTQTLADGNRIVRSSASLIARDSEGRTRREQRGGSVLFITDPVADVNYVIEPRSRSAWKFAPSNAATARTPAESNGVSGRLSEATTNINRESLGTQTIEGILADGIRMTRTIPAGQAGNELPVEITSEIWYSTELQTAVMTDKRDPRLGEISSKLTHIQLDEPAHSLFEVPADYTILDGFKRLEPSIGNSGTE